MLCKNIVEHLFYALLYSFLGAVKRCSTWRKKSVWYFIHRTSNLAIDMQSQVCLFDPRFLLVSVADKVDSAIYMCIKLSLKSRFGGKRWFNTPI